MFHSLLFSSENKYLTDDDVAVYPLNMINLDSNEEAFLHVIDKFGKVRFTYFVI